MHFKSIKSEFLVTAFLNVLAVIVVLPDVIHS